MKITENQPGRKSQNTILHVMWSFLCALLITGIYFVAAYRYFPFVYDINDDVAMRNVAAGVITGTPDAHLIHMKYVLGFVISGLYRMFEGLDWYGIVMIGMILWSFSMILYRGIVSKKSLSFKAVYVVLSLTIFTCIGLQHIVAFQWTVAASITGAAGIFLFYTSDAEERFQIIFEEGMAVLLILTTLCIRDDVFLMVLPVAGLCFLWKYCSLKRTNRFFFHMNGHYGVPAALILGIALIMGTEAYEYRSAEWKEFLTYNVDREAIMDYYGLPEYKENQDYFESLGLSEKEVVNLHRYSLYLVDGLYSETMHKLAGNAKELYEQEHSVSQRLEAGVKKIAEHTVKPIYAPVNWIALGILVFVWYLCIRKDRKQLGLCLSVTATFVLFWLYLGFRGRIVERVGFAMYLLEILTMLGIAYRRLLIHGPQKEGQERNAVIQKNTPGEKNRNDILKISAITGICILSVLLAGVQIKKIKEIYSERQTYNLQFLAVNDYMAEHPENVYFMTTFSIETFTDNFSLKRDFAFSNLLSVGGWHTFSPLENEKLRKLSVENAEEAILMQENVYLISCVNIDYMDRYFTEKYGESYGGYDIVDSLTYGLDFEVYDFHFNTKAEKTYEQ